MDRLARLAPLSGIVAVALIVIGWILISNFTYFPEPQRALAMVTDDPFRFQRGAVFVGVYASFFLIWFVGSLGAVLRVREAGTGYLSLIAVVGGLVVVIALSVGAAILWIASARVDRTAGVGVEYVLVMYDISQNVLAAVVSLGFAALLAATGLLSLSTKLFPVWLGWASVVSGIGLLTPIHYVFMLPALVWIVVVSILLYRQGDNASVRAAAPGPGADRPPETDYTEVSA